MELRLCGLAIDDSFRLINLVINKLNNPQNWMNWLNDAENFSNE